MNSVLATFRLSLFATSHFLRFSKSEFTATSRSVREFPEAVRFVSSANKHGLVLFRHCGKSFIYSKNNSGPKMNLVAHHILLIVQMRSNFVFGIFGFGL